MDGARIHLRAVRVMAHTHCTGPGQGRDWEMTGSYITLCTVHTTQGQGKVQGPIFSIVSILFPVPAPVLAAYVSH